MHSVAGKQAFGTLAKEKATNVNNRIDELQLKIGISGTLGKHICCIAYNRIIPMIYCYILLYTVASRTTSHNEKCGKSLKIAIAKRFKGMIIGYPSLRPAGKANNVENREDLPNTTHLQRHSSSPNICIP